MTDQKMTTTRPPLSEVLTSRSARQAYQQARDSLAAGETHLRALRLIILASERQAWADSHDWIVRGVKVEG